MRCVIVDDIAGSVDAARGLLERQGITVVGVASNTTEALRCFEELRPDVTPVDIDSVARAGSNSQSDSTGQRRRHIHR